MKAFKKVIAASFVAAAILGIAASASAKTLPTVPGQVTVMLYKEKASCPDNRWVADYATSFIPFKNLAWDATIFDISVNNKKTAVENRCVGAYELNICKGTYTKPGDSSVVKFYVKQKIAGDWEYKKYKVAVKYIAAINPVKAFTFTGTDALGHTYTKDFASNFANSGKTVKNVDYTVPAGITDVTVKFTLADKYYTGAGCKMYATLKSGKEIRVYNGNMYDLSKICSFKVEYKTTVALWKAFSKAYNGGWKSYKAPNDSFKGTKHLDNVKSIVLNLK